MITVLIPLYILYTVLIYTVSIQEINIFNHFILIGHITIHLLSETSCCRQLKLKEKCFSVISHFLGGGVYSIFLEPFYHPQFILQFSSGAGDDAQSHSSIAWLLCTTFILSHIWTVTVFAADLSLSIFFQYECICSHTQQIIYMMYNSTAEKSYANRG